MNKLTKGSLATGAGLVLLLGGTGTFMTWNDDEAITGGSVVAGTLDVETMEVGTWTINNIPTANIDTAAIVPGDEVVYTTILSVTAEGDTLSAALNMTDSAITPVLETDAEDKALVTALTNNVTTDLEPVNASSTFITDNTATTTNLNDYVVDADGITKTEQVKATVTIVFPNGGEDQDELAMLGSVNLSGMDVTLDQNIAA